MGETEVSPIVSGILVVVGGSVVPGLIGRNDRTLVYLLLQLLPLFSAFHPDLGGREVWHLDVDQIRQVSVLEENLVNEDPDLEDPTSEPLELIEIDLLFSSLLELSFSSITHTLEVFDLLLELLDLTPESLVVTFEEDVVVDRRRNELVLLVEQLVLLDEQDRRNDDCYDPDQYHHLTSPRVIVENLLLKSDVPHLLELGVGERVLSEIRSLNESRERYSRVAPPFVFLEPPLLELLRYDEVGDEENHSYDQE